MQKVQLPGGLEVANHLPFTLFGGVNVIESYDLVLEAAQHYQQVCHELGIPLVFKASWDKANRSSVSGFRGLGLEQGLGALAEVKKKFSLPIITDIHEPHQAAPVAEVADVLQIPAFLARQTDLIMAAAATGKPLHIKKPQFLAAEDMINVVKKCQEAGNHQILLGERGTCFGYHNLIVDMLGVDTMKASGWPVVFDVTHSLQLPGGLGHAAGGRRQQINALARSGMAVGLAGLFLEAHPDPTEALCDGPCALELGRLKEFLSPLKRLDDLVKQFDHSQGRSGVASNQTGAHHEHA